MGPETYRERLLRLRVVAVVTGAVWPYRGVRMIRCPDGDVRVYHTGCTTSTAFPVKQDDSSGKTGDTAENAH